MFARSFYLFVLSIAVSVSASGSSALENCERTCEEFFQSLELAPQRSCRARLVADKGIFHTSCTRTVSGGQLEGSYQIEVAFDGYANSKQSYRLDQVERVDNEIFNHDEIKHRLDTCRTLSDRKCQIGIELEDLLLQFNEIPVPERVTLLRFNSNNLLASESDEIKLFLFEGNNSQVAVWVGGSASGMLPKTESFEFFYLNNEGAENGTD